MNNKLAQSQAVPCVEEIECVLGQETFSSVPVTTHGDNWVPANLMLGAQ